LTRVPPPRASALKDPAVVFDGHLALSVARGFASMVEKSAYRIFACAILPEHVHLVLGRRAQNGWKVFLNSVADSERAIRYVENNPVKEGKRPQRWPLVIPFIDLVTAIV